MRKNAQAYKNDTSTEFFFSHETTAVVVDKQLWLLSSARSNVDSTLGGGVSGNCVHHAQ